MLTLAQREKLLKQREQYEKAADGLDEQLLKLKVLVVYQNRTAVYIVHSVLNMSYH